MSTQRVFLRAAWRLCSVLLVVFLVSASPVEALRLAAPKNQVNSSNLIQAWRSVTAGAPSIRAYHTAVWTGSVMIVWGGQGSTEGYLNDGACYNPTTDRWMPISTNGAPSVRAYHTAVWTGSKMIIWGGWDGINPGDNNAINNGARLGIYYPLYLPFCRKE